MTTFFGALYNGLIKLGENLQSFVLLVFRLVWGYSFFQAGLGKLMGLGTTALFFQKLAIPLPEVTAFLVAVIECFGGILLMLGLGTRLSALLLAIVMVGAFLTAHFDALTNIFVDPISFTKQSAFNFLLVSLLLFAFGPGRISLDYLIERKTQKPEVK